MFDFTFVSIHLNELIEAISVISITLTVFNFGYSAGLRRERPDKSVALMTSLVAALVTVVVIIL